MPSRAVLVTRRIIPVRVKNYYYSDGNGKYTCENSNLDAATTDENWKIYKDTYDANGNPDETEGPRVGAVNSEAVINALPWNI